MAKMTLEELRNLRDKKKLEISRREAEGKESQVIIGMGTCGITAGAKATLDSFLSGLTEHNLVESVMVRQTGCFGYCHSEPTVEVVVPGMPPIIYGNVDAAVAKEIIKKHIIGRELLEHDILNKPSIDIIRSK